MMYSEFTERTGFYPDANLYRMIEEAYYDFEGDKNEFCKAYQANKDGLAEKIARAACQRAQNEIKKVEDKVWEVRDDLKEAEQKIKRLEAKLEREQEWMPWTDKDSISDHFYVSGKAAAYNSFENDKEAKGWIASEFGFAESKIEILHTKGVFEINRHGQLRKVGEVNRDPWYNATDWYYVLFQVCGIVYEAYNGSLIQH